MGRALVALQLYPAEIAVDQIQDGKARRIPSCVAESARVDDPGALDLLITSTVCVPDHHNLGCAGKHQLSCLYRVDIVDDGDRRPLKCQRVHSSKSSGSEELKRGVRQTGVVVHIALRDPDIKSIKEPQGDGARDVTGVKDARNPLGP